MWCMFMQRHHKMCLEHTDSQGTGVTGAYILAGRHLPDRRLNGDFAENA